MTDFPWPTVGSHDFYEVLSALQKSIRQGLERDALFWATELYLSDYASHAWARLKIIASEDVGLADNNVAFQIRALYNNWLERKPKKGTPPLEEADTWLYFVHAVLILVRAPKSRIVDNATIHFKSVRKNLEMPDWALDKHTERGRAMGRGDEHFREEGAKLNNCSLPDPYERKFTPQKESAEEDSDHR